MSLFRKKKTPHQIFMGQWLLGTGLLKEKLRNPNRWCWKSCWIYNQSQSHTRYRDCGGHDGGRIGRLGFGCQDDRMCTAVSIVGARDPNLTNLWRFSHWQNSLWFAIFIHTVIIFGSHCMLISIHFQNFIQCFHQLSNNLLKSFDLFYGFS